MTSFLSNFANYGYDDDDYYYFYMFFISGNYFLGLSVYTEQVFYYIRGI